MSYGYPDGCTQADHDRAFDQALSEPPDEDVVRLDCGHWGTEDAAETLADKKVCERCYLQAEALGVVFEGLEVPALIDALTMYGPSRLGNHDLFAHLMKKLERAREWKKQREAA